MHNHRNYYFVVSTFAILFLFICGSLQAQVKEQDNFLSQKKELEKIAEVRIPQLFASTKKIIEEFEQTFHERDNAKAHFKNLSKRDKKSIPLKKNIKMFYGVDTVIAFRSTDTFRYSISYDSLGTQNSYLYEKWQSGQWINFLRSTDIYTESGNQLTTLTEFWGNGTWWNSNRITKTYDVRGNQLSYLSEWWRNEQWLMDYRETYTYDASDNQISVLLEQSEMRPSRINYTYDERGNQLTRLVEIWNGGQWEIFLLDTYTYDADNNILSWLGEKSDAGLIVSFGRNTSTYDTNGNQLTFLYESRSNEQWHNYYKLTNTYDANGNQLTNLRENWINGLWADAQLIINTYDINNNQLSGMMKGWGLDQWINYWRFNCTYDATGNQLSYLYETSYTVDGTWSNRYRNSYTYNVNGDTLTHLNEEWSNGQWGNSYLFTYTYDQNGNCSSVNSDHWLNSQPILKNEMFKISDGSGNSYSFYGYKINLQYKLLATNIENGNDGIIESYQLSQNYPNPFNPTTSIDYDLPLDGKVTLKIYDMLGCEVKTLVDEYQESGKYTTSFDARKLSSGIYVYKIVSGSYSAQKKMLLLK